MRQSIAQRERYHSPKLPDFNDFAHWQCLADGLEVTGQRAHRVTTRIAQRRLQIKPLPRTRLPALAAPAYNSRSRLRLNHANRMPSAILQFSGR